MAELTADKILLQTLVAAGAGTVNGAGNGPAGGPSWVDLSAYRSGAFWLLVTTIAAGSITPSFQMSPDNGTTIVAGGIPTAELAAPIAVTVAGAVRYPFIGNMQQAFVRVSSVIATGPVTAQMFFIGKV